MRLSASQVVMRMPLTKNVGVWLTPLLEPLRKSVSIFGRYTPSWRSREKRRTSRPSVSAQAISSAGSSASWFAKSIECIGQKRPSAPAASAACAASRACG